MVTSTHIFVVSSFSHMPTARAYTRAGVRDPDRDVPYLINEGSSSSRNNIDGADATDTRQYVIKNSSGGDNPTVEVYQLGAAVEFGGYVAYQFDTADFDSLFFLAANNARGNIIDASPLTKVKVYKYRKSTRTWTDPLNEGTGQPQLSHPYRFPGEAVTYLADNRKNFQVVQHNGDTLVFYRRAQATQSGIAYYNDTTSTVTDVYTESHVGTENYGLPYSMDFALDVRSDGIYVYTFVVRYTFETDGDYNGGTLKVYRKRVEPNGTQTEIYSETFTKSVDEEDYPVSVSDLILADNRSKFYFVLEYHGEGGPRWQIGALHHRQERERQPNRHQNLRESTALRSFTSGAEWIVFLPRRRVGASTKKRSIRRGDSRR